MKLRQRITEFVIESAIKLSGFLIIGFVILIFLFLLKDALSLFRVYPAGQFLFGRNWLPISEPPQFGMLPLLIGSVYVTIGAIVICVPLGVGRSRAKIN